VGSVGIFNHFESGILGEWDGRSEICAKQLPLYPLGEWSDVFDYEVLPLLDPTTRALLGRVGQACRDAVLRFPKLPCAGRTVGVKLQIKEFVVSVQLLAWAKENGCPWEASVCSWAARGGYLEVLQWARNHHCPWSASTCKRAAVGGHLEVLKWARDHNCEWDALTCACAAQGGHLAVLRWALEHHCPCDWVTCASAARHGQLEVLKWALERGCP